MPFSCQSPDITSIQKYARGCLYLTERSTHRPGRSLTSCRYHYNYSYYPQCER